MMVGSSGTNTRALTEGALLAALTVLLALVGTVFSYIYMLVPVPLIILVYRHGMNWGIVVGLASALLTGMLSALPNTIGVVNLGAVGLALGGMMRERRPPLLTLGVGTLVGMVAMGISILITAVIFGVNDISMLIRTLEETGKQVAGVYARLGVDEKTLEQFTETLTRTLRTLLPSAFVLSATIIALVNFGLARLLLRRLGENVPGLPPFRAWEFPPALALTYLIALVAGLFLPPRANPIATAVVVNIAWLLGVLFLLEGLAVAWVWMERVRVAKFLRVLLLYFALFYFYYGIVLLGVVDSWAHFRRRIAS